MAPSRIDLKARVAVLGAASPAGARVRAALADRAVPGERVALFGHGGEIAVLSEYDGEARLVQPAAELDPATFGAAFVCEPGHDAGALVSAARGGLVVIDLTGTIADFAPPAGSPHERIVSIPHPLTLLIHPVLAALHGSLGLRAASAFVLRPAADFGEPGLEELREQAVHLLRFESTPTTVFGRQLAFSIVPEQLAPREEADAGARIARECRVLLAVDGLEIAVTTALVPVFLGHAVALHATVVRGDASRARAALAEAAGITLAADPSSGTTLDAPDQPGVTVVSVVDAHPGGLRLWILGGEPGSLAAERAVDAAAEAGVVVNVS